MSNNRISQDFMKDAAISVVKTTAEIIDKFDELAQEISILKTQQNENPSEIRVERINSNELMEPTNL
ncbi:20744_t:CDS:2 [Gigaspora rosea]|nr:20744_t:CDS:2 [Gigaspora rosea]